MQYPQDTLMQVRRQRDTGSLVDTMVWLVGRRTSCRRRPRPVRVSTNGRLQTTVVSKLSSESISSGIRVGNQRPETSVLRDSVTAMLIGYGRVSTAEQNPAHQIDALTRAGVAERDIHIDTASGA